MYEEKKLDSSVQDDCNVLREKLRQAGLRQEWRLGERKGLERRTLFACNGALGSS